MRMLEEIKFEAKIPNQTQIDHMIGTFSAPILKEIYYTSVESLRFRHKMATLKTHSEIYLIKQLKRATKLEVHT